ncbi:MAG: energy-coupling factor transporter transmembrane protein EcfT [Flintibacter sp.]|uniref:energy-coupling factor transporter transmembrane component T family protein n=1 Tax=Flintibacter sp. TaxID=1918624 RepID=UPI002D809C30|nr:energy-coupling factor transporter transmembrane component T [Flintibacter sp.]MCI7159443.1 energy-coupling factor transporter transmembrane protein EcfT [Flintibacter sp.]MCI7659528.1 energy-coupling factor transporter transmembrane protein EcfT [Flintibacter sp.]
MALKDITLGQYFPGHSFVHKLDPRTKLLAVVLYIVALFLAKSFITYGIMFLLLAVSIAISKVPLKSIVRGLKPVVFIVVFTAILNLFYTPGDHVLVKVWILTITLEGVFNAFFMVVRILMLIAGTFLLTYTTSPILLTDALESLLGPLKKIKVPVHELAMIMSIALRFIPTLIEETDKIMSAQRARGADFESGNLIQRAKALIPLLVPLFISAFRRADELAVAMECRCYHGGEGRTRLRQLHYVGRDYFVLVLFVVLTVLVGVLGRMGL